MINNYKNKIACSSFNPSSNSLFNLIQLFWISTVMMDNSDNE